jgi:hypothetical protein
MQQEELWYDSAEEAIRNAITNSGKRMKEVAHELWPHMKMDSANTRLSNSLDPTKAEKLTLDEIVHICRVTGRPDPLFYMADETGYSRPEIRAPEDEEALLMREFVQSQRRMEQVVQRMERLNGVRMTRRTA